MNKVRCNWPGCDYAATLDHLWQHQFIHKFKSQLEPIVCNYANCGQTFSTKQHLMEHMNDVHNKNKELPRQQSIPPIKPCVSYGSRERDEQYLQKKSAEQLINVVHNNIETYVCPEPGCQYRTTYKDKLVLHSRTHHNESQTKLTCKWPECTYATTCNSDLERHYTIHANERPFKCHYPGCGRKYKTIDTFKHHIDKHLQSTVRPRFNLTQNVAQKF